jgi:hypothetical protein
MKLRYDRRILVLALAAGAPGILASLLLLWAGDYSTSTIVTTAAALLVLWALAASSLRHRIVFPLQTMANPLEALVPQGAGRGIFELSQSLKLSNRTRMI